uniref:Putative transcription factor grauzone n=1 Tax=Aedes aegypti TaxID=7159 RepID=A0A0P6JRV7_AEDAE
MSDCLTCAKSTEGVDQSLAIVANKKIQNALSKHFWFGENQYLKSTICYPCWHKIEDFHRFYCEVEELHSKQLFPHIQLLELKQENAEPDFAPEQSDDDVECVVESEDPCDVGEQKIIESQPEIKETVKRPRLQKNELDVVQEYASQNVILDCDTCSKRCTTFETLQRHSMMEHARKATVLCCNLKFTNTYRFVDHMRFHMDPSQFKCSHCTKEFGNREALKRHTRLVHAYEQQKPTSAKEDDEPNETNTETVRHEPAREDQSSDESSKKVQSENESEDMAHSVDEPDYKVQSDDKPGDKVEIEDESDGEKSIEDNTSDNDEDYEQGSDDSVESISSGSDEDYDADDSKRNERKLRKYTKTSEEESVAIQEYVSKNLTLNCDTCSERYTIFKDLQRHSLDTHGKPATVLCCNRKLLNSYRFDDHIRYHLNPDRFQCSQCSRKCPNREALSRHIQTKHTPDEEKTHACEVCNKKFTTKHNLTKHALIHEESVQKPARKRRLRETAKHDKMIAENVTLECDSCQEQHTSFVKLQQHSKAEHKKHAVVFCCGLKFHRKPLLIDHLYFHLEPTRFQCKICHKNLHHTRSLKWHMDKYHAPEESRTLQCSKCPKMFTHQRFLVLHEQYHNRKWHCKICDKRFIYEAVLKQHHKSVHTKELQYVCHVCAKTFHIYSSYRSHLLTHDESAKKKPQKPRVQCQICNTWTLKLSRHMRLHAGTRTCEICGEECKNHFTYRYHMKNHQTGDFICSVCGKSFKREIGWKEHMASHTGDVLYSCDFCDRTFNSNANRASHRKKMHPQQWLEDKLKKRAAKMAPVDEPAQS